MRGNSMLFMDEIRYMGRPLSGAGRDPEELRCYDFLDSLGVVYDRVDHEAADTIEECHAIEGLLGAKVCKNLFLCNRQKTDFYLLLMEGDKAFKTKFLSAQLGCARLSFAGPEDMEALLGVRPGSVSVLGLMNDKEKKVRLIIDQPLLSWEYVGCHPCRNTSTLRLSMGDLMERVLPALGVGYTAVNLPEEEA